jgi:8-amino-7-oxononanoate synthase
MTALERLVRRRRQAFPELVRRLKSGGLVQQTLTAADGPRVRVRGRWVLNFAATNYLGLNDARQVVEATARAVHRTGISLGMPRLFGTDSLTARLEVELARLVGQESALVFPSTTHIALDVLPLLAGPGGALFVDQWAYPISLEGVHAAARRGARVHRFPHNDHRALATALRAQAARPDKVIVCDGVYSTGGHVAPLREFAHLARTFEAVIYVDDAHGVGLLGSNPTRGMPYGRGGGGTPRHLGMPSGNVVHVGSLSKAFGVPLAFVAGPAGFVDHVRATAATNMHSSPPALPTVAAALGALQFHSVYGEVLRHRLADRVRRFRAGLARVGVTLSRNRLFPIQTLRFATPRAAEAVACALRRLGIWAVLQLNPDDHPTGGVLRFVVTTRHEDADLHAAVAAIARTSKLPQ